MAVTETTDDDAETLVIYLNCHSLAIMKREVFFLINYPTWLENRKRGVMTSKSLCVFQKQ